LFVGEKSEVEGYDLLKAVLKMYKKEPAVKYIIRNITGASITEEELVKEINQSKIMLALSRNEPFGLLPIEAMACGVPVIAVSEGGLKESVIDGVTGYLIKRDKSKLKKQIGLLLNNDGLRNKLGKNSRNRVLSKFTWDESVERFLAIIKQ
jgi:glycosyltransferase involved in cell wall biosynthesis